MVAQKSIHATTPLKYKDKEGNLVPVNGHTMRISIDDIDPTGSGGSIASSDYSKYAYFVDQNGNPLLDNGVPVTYVDATTSTDGSAPDNPQKQGVATVYMKGGPLVFQADTIKLKAEDQTQVK